MGYLAHIIGIEPSEIKNWFGSEVSFFDVIFAGQQLSRTCKSVIRLSFLAGRREPQATAFIYRDRLIWSCRFRQRQLRYTQRNPSCKVSYEYEELADFPCVIVCLWRSIIFSGSILSLSLFAFVFSSGSKALSVKDRAWEPKDKLGMIFCWFGCPFAFVESFM